MLDLIKSLNRGQKRLILLSLDALLIPIALIFAYGVQTPARSPADALTDTAAILPYLVVLAAVTSNWLGLPKVRLNAYEIRAVGRTALLSIYLTIGAAILMEVSLVEAGLGLCVVFGVGYFLLSVASRLLLRQILMSMYRRAQRRVNVLIYGAGATGTQLAQAFTTHDTIHPVAFVDDNTALQGLTVAGLPVYAPVHIEELVATRQIDRVLLAVPSLSLPKQMQIARRLEPFGLEIQMLPSFSQLIGEEALTDKLTPVVPGTFLGRAQLDQSVDGLADIYRSKSVLVSGAGGSIGSEICRQILVSRPERIVLFDHSELALYTVDQELQQIAEGSGVEIVPVLGSVSDARHVRRILQQNEIEIVLHAAAYKHVPIVENNPLAGLHNNVIGTHTLAREAEDFGVERFILISSDKAVRPKNVMGASKRLSELVVQDLATRSRKTVFAMVRFGNVLGSSGSVVPLFQEQILRGGPVTVTHEDVTRYFMTIQEAVHLVLMAGSFAEGGEVYVLDMGKPVAIRELARHVIEASGYSVRDADTPDGDIEIVLTGLRPGEKLHEELTIRAKQACTQHEKIFSVREDHLSEIEIASALRDLRTAIEAGDVERARAIAERWVDTSAASIQAEDASQRGPATS